MLFERGLGRAEALSFLVGTAGIAAEYGITQRIRTAEDLGRDDCVVMYGLSIVEPHAGDWLLVSAD